MSARQGFRGYVSARGFGPYQIPVPLQSLALRDYCARKRLVYVLPANENCFPHSYLILDGLISDLSQYEGIVLCSMHMLPRRPERRRRICDRVLEQSCSLHFVIEDFVIASPGDLARFEELLTIDQLAAGGPKVVLDPA
jgi:sporadic carbohydrate cluster protein (TIGR04323 family)